LESPLALAGLAILLVNVQSSNKTHFKLTEDVPKWLGESFLMELTDAFRLNSMPGTASCYHRGIYTLGQRFLKGISAYMHLCFEQYLTVESSTAITALLSNVDK
jgi:hypothetical protein